MKKIIKKAFLFLLIFCMVLAGALTYNWYRNRQTVSYAAMEKATLPTIEVVYREGYGNRLHGYLEEMDVGTMRQTITPLMDRRRITISMNTYGAAIDQIIYQLRSTDGKRLVEDGIMDKWTKDGDIWTQELQLANLMEQGQEYMLLFLIQSGDNTIRYYNRVIYMEENHTDEMIQFVLDFSEATYTGNRDLIVNYLQPNDTMKLDDLSYINIHSRYQMFIWAGLSPVITGKVNMEITELSDSQMTATLNYPISLTYADTTKEYEVEEQFVVRYRTGTLYLLDYDRFLSEKFEFSNMQIDNGAIWLGITSKESKTMQSENEKVQAFIYDNQLWSCEKEQGKMSFIFSYLDGEDERGKLDHYTIQLVRVSDNGDIDFTVSGYHNRGKHEGCVGICFYRYLSEESKIEELFYIPAQVSEEVLRQELGGITYVSESDLLYFLYGNTIYSVDLASKERMDLATQDNADGFYYNESGNIVAWHEGSADWANQIVVVNLESGTIFRIEAEEGEFLEIQGFIGMDIIYAVGRFSDAGLLSGAIDIQPFSSLHFATVGDTLEESGVYEKEGTAILSTEMGEDGIEIVRVSKNGAAYAPMENDQVFLNVRDEEFSSGIMSSRQSEGFLKESYISLDFLTEDLKLLEEPCLYRQQEASMVLEVSRDSLATRQYYVYGKGSLLGCYTKLSEAIQKAYDAMGCVVDSSQNYIWTRGTRDLYKTLTLPAMTCESERESLETCLRLFLSYEGAAVSQAEILLSEGKSVYDILSESLETRTVDLSGCTVLQILYYLHLGHPVLAVTGDYSAVLVIGYETTAVTLYNPFNGETIQMSIEEAQNYFEKLGSRFYSCL